LSPAYGIVSTLSYVNNEQEFALNLAKNKNWYQANMASFETWAKRIGVPWQAIKVHLEDTLELAKGNWLNMLTDLLMDELHQQKLKAHWQNLHHDFRIEYN